MLLLTTLFMFSIVAGRTKAFHFETLLEDTLRSESQAQVPSDGPNAELVKAIQVAISPITRLLEANYNINRLSAQTLLYRWVSTTDNNLHPSAVRGGLDKTGALQFICRVRHDGHLIIGKGTPSHRGCFYSWSGQERRAAQFELLVAHPEAEVQWVEAADGFVPPGAVQGGITNQGSPLFVGRADLTVGNVEPSEKAIFILHGRREVKLDKYEVLVIKVRQTIA